jgi:uncharacterized Zn finger protein (UPF0148 family)
METCPKCGTRYIQYDNITGELYCLVRDCMHRWHQQLSRQIENIYLRTSIHE